jgi:ATP-binding cassette subfamily B protein
VKRNWLLYLVIISLALNFGTIGTFAYLRYQDQKQSLTREPPPPMPMRDLWKKLNLDEGQRQAVRRLFPEHRAKVMELRQALFQKRQELFELLRIETPDMDAIRAKVGEISTLQGKLEEELVRHMLEFRKHLKPEQNAAFLDLVRSRLSGPVGPWGGWRGPWRGGPGLGPPPRPGMGPCPGPETAPRPGLPGPGKEPGPTVPGRPD